MELSEFSQLSPLDKRKLIRCPQQLNEYLKDVLNLVYILRYCFDVDCDLRSLDPKRALGFEQTCTSERTIGFEQTCDNIESQEFDMINIKKIISKSKKCSDTELDINYRLRKVKRNESKATRLYIINRYGYHIEIININNNGMPILEYMANQGYNKIYSNTDLYGIKYAINLLNFNDFKQNIIIRDKYLNSITLICDDNYKLNIISSPKPIGITANIELNSEKHIRFNSGGQLEILRTFKKKINITKEGNVSLRFIEKYCTKTFKEHINNFTCNFKITSHGVAIDLKCEKDYLYENEEVDNANSPYRNHNYQNAVEKNNQKELKNCRLTQPTQSLGRKKQWRQLRQT